MIFESLFGKQESVGNRWNQINNQGNKLRFQITSTSSSPSSRACGGCTVVPQKVASYGLFVIFCKM